MSHPAPRPDLRPVGITEEWGRRAHEHNEAAREERLMVRARRFAELRNQDAVRAYERAMDLLEAQHAWRVATDQPDPYTGPLDAAGYPTMTEQQWADIHGVHPSPPPPSPSTPSPVDDVRGDVEQEVEDKPGPEVVPDRKRGEPLEVWAARVLAANRDRTIGWKRLSTLVGGGLTEGPGRRIVAAHRAATS